MRNLIGVLLFLGIAAVAGAQTSLVGPTFGRARVSSFPGPVVLTGPTQQTISASANGTVTVVSTLAAASTPVALGITDRLVIQGSRLSLLTDFDPCGCEPTIRATGRASVNGSVITYSAQNRAADLQVRGRIRIRGSIIERVERRIQEGDAFTIRYVLYRR